jgi:hypothetical protein
VVKKKKLLLLLHPLPLLLLLTLLPHLLPHLLHQKPLSNFYYCKKTTARWFFFVLHFLFDVVSKDFDDIFGCI